LLCFALRLLCKLPGSPGEVKNTGSHTANLVCPNRPPPGV
jgi:hypothetical protein